MHFRTLNTKKNRPFQPRILVKSMIEMGDFLIKLVIPAGVEPTTYCLGEMLTASLSENCTAL
jgi:hypothetical protein